MEFEPMSIWPLERPLLPFSCSIFHQSSYHLWQGMDLFILPRMGLLHWNVSSSQAFTFMISKMGQWYLDCRDVSISRCFQIRVVDKGCPNERTSRARSDTFWPKERQGRAWGGRATWVESWQWIKYESTEKDRKAFQAGDIALAKA